MIDSDMKKDTTDLSVGTFKSPIFHGQGMEFFKIWVVNILLTILTLGIYSAWAKVRNLKYLYGATELENARFGFHGDPVAILKGRIISGVILILYLFGAKLSVYVTLLGLLLIYFSFPFLFVKSMKFRLSNTSYRNIRFRFRGTIKEAYDIWFKYTVPFLIYFILSTLMAPAINSMDNNSPASPTLYAFFILLILFVIFFFVLAPKFYNAVINYFYNHAYYGGNQFKIVSTVQTFKKEVFMPIVLRYVGIFVFFFASILLFTFILKAASAIVFPTLLFYIGLFACFIYFLYSIKHYVWSRLFLNPEHKLNSRLEFKPYFKISLVNGALILCSLGLLYPWAKMRSLKYLIENREIQIDDFDAFTAKAEDSISALGEEVVDTFDFDIEIGL